MYYLYLMLSVLLIGVQYCVLKVYQLKIGNSVLATLLFSTFAGAVSCLFVLCVNGFSVQVNLYSTLMALLLAAGISMNNLLGIKVISLGKVSVYTLFLMLGGMVCPYLYGVIFLNESAGVWRWTALILLVAAMAISCAGPRQEGEKRSDWRFYVLCLLAFLFNGAVSIISKAHQVAEGNSPTNDFLIVAYLFLFALNAVAAGVAALHSRSKGELPAWNGRTAAKGFGVIAAYALVSAAAFFIQVDAAIHLPATVLYPIVTGGTVIVSAVFGRIFFREKITRMIAVSLIVALGATCLFLLP